jgi:type 1 glutamine amidotransferase
VRGRVLALVLLLATLAAPTVSAAAPRFKVLVFTRTEGFRHASIPDAVGAVRKLGRKNRFAVIATADAGVFTRRSLARFRVVMFLLTTGDVLDPPQERALRRYVVGGGNFVGVHSASDTEFGWKFYGTLVGARFRNHPRVQRARLIVEQRTHPATRGLPRSFRRTDEWYAWRTNPRGHVHVLVRIDEQSYQPGLASMGRDHPLAWYHRVGKGRSFYTALGHTAASYHEPRFLRHLRGAILWAAGVAH